MKSKPKELSHKIAGCEQHSNDISEIAIALFKSTLFYNKFQQFFVIKKYQCLNQIILLNIPKNRSFGNINFQNVD